jgi:hypothetical protein
MLGDSESERSAKYGHVTCKFGYNWEAPIQKHIKSPELLFLVQLIV